MNPVSLMLKNCKNIWRFEKDGMLSAVLSIMGRRQTEFL
jgi:hypothetical protein